MDHRARLHQLLIDKLYSQRILNNSHRGDFVEMMVLDALGPEWKHVGLGWHLWDLQRGSGHERVRIQVKQCAALQIWGRTKLMIFQSPWSDGAPAYIRRDFPNEALEDNGWFCELFVVGIHAVADEEECDHTDPEQWQFMVAPAHELKPRQKSMVLAKAIKRWPPGSLTALRDSVEAQLRALPRGAESRV